MKHLVLALAIAAAAGCTAERAPTDDAATPPSAEAPTPPADDTAPPSADDTPDTPPPADTSATVPATFQGSWAAGAAACTTAGHESHLPLGADRLQFHASSGTIRSVASGATDLTIVAVLTGEGEAREATYRFRLSDDGKTLTDMSSGPGMVRQRCG